MTQNDEEKNALHDFNDIESREARDYNRGAVLANIHEQYLGEGYIRGEVVKEWLGEMTSYLNRIPEDEWDSAKVSMKSHLDKRGYA